MAETTWVTRAVSRLCVLLFLVSTAFPVAAGVFDADRLPRWVAVADIAVAGLLLVAAIYVAMRNQHRVNDEHRAAAFHRAQTVSSLIPALLLVFFLTGDWINWDVLVIGLAWRGWLLLQTLPFLAASAPRRQ